MVTPLSWFVIFGLGLVLVWLVALSVWVYRVTAHYSRLAGKTGKDDLKVILEKLIKGYEETKRQTEITGEELKKLGRKTYGHIQKVGVVRFNPFGDTGGNQSAAVALLDGGDSGIVILVLHGREGTRVYVKTVKNGRSAYDLSREEMEALEQARKGKR